jgi:hypothetical protein
MPFPNYSGGQKSNLTAFQPKRKKPKNMLGSTPNQKKMTMGNAVNTGPSDNFKKKFGVIG